MPYRNSPEFRFDFRNAVQSVAIPFSATKLYLVVQLGRLAPISGASDNGCILFAGNRERRLGAKSHLCPAKTMSYRNRPKGVIQITLATSSALS
jgi:hypothetical protein